MNELHKEVKKRLELVSNRLIALEKEQKILLIEQEGLQKLDSLYSHITYDSITEERRVTEAILHSEESPQIEPAPVKIHYGGKIKGVSQYDEPIEVIFTTNKNPIKFYKIHEQLEILTDKKLQLKNVDQILRQQAKKGRIRRVAPSTYVWIGGSNAETQTLSDRGCSET
jgi:hypothetical protein